MKNSGNKHVIVWVDGFEHNPVSLWFKAFYSSKSWLENRLEDENASVDRTSKFSDACVFDSFEEAWKVFDAPAVKQVFGGKMFIRYYSDKDYFKELLSRE